MHKKCDSGIQHKSLKCVVTPQLPTKPEVNCRTYSSHRRVHTSPASHKGGSLAVQ